MLEFQERSPEISGDYYIFHFGINQFSFVYFILKYKSPNRDQCKIPKKIAYNPIH